MARASEARLKSGGHECHTAAWPSPRYHQLCTSPAVVPGRSSQARVITMGPRSERQRRRGLMHYQHRQRREPP